MRPTTARLASTSKSSSFHSPDKRGNSRRALGSVESPDGSFLQRFVTARWSPPVIPSTPAQGWRACYGTGTTNRECPMKALAISMVAGAALCSLMSVPASAMPMSNLAAAASDLALGQSVRYVRHPYRYRLSRSSYYAYGAGYPGYARDCYGRGFGPGSPCYP